ncbi:glutathione-S-transferase [Tilletiopsis washingtonensis]|uniref:Glutathione-S-transferase n=1 Tax=Tilletiopsis washingtonensis TaxID=58919 RepID=A0A316ZDY5_9BASI|nr:glutathione-S-transferase [Tilletiopsis washingtonensis]PWN99741.1 glutathione-S-transferase [Tilletiopsis washingtonensis]
MASVDKSIHSAASGVAAETAAKHSKPASNGLVFYSGWFCPFVARVWIALEEKGIDYEYREINPYKKEAHFLAINPKGLVPAVEHDGAAMYESLVLLEYLEETFPSTAPLFPSKNTARAHVRMHIDQVVKKIMPSFYKTLQAQQEEEQKEARKTLTAAFKEYAEAFPNSSKPFHGGDKPDAVDVALAPWACRLFLLEEHRGGPFQAAEVGEAFIKWRKAIQDWPSVKAVLSTPEKYTEVYQRYLNDEAMSEAAKATRSGGVIP